MSSGLADRHWDAIVIGTGMGGGTVGRALAEKGLSVLFVEKGRKGHRAEQTALDANLSDRVARKIRGFWPDPIEGQINGRRISFYPPLGAGVGGSSVYYAAALERPEPHDLDHSPERPHPAGGWPVRYAAFHPYLEAAERIYHICGSADPLSSVPADNLRPPPDLPPGDAALMAQMQRIGLHPYRLHTAVRYLEGCLDCLGVKCPRNCKMDGRSAGVEPALATGRAALLERCEVTALRGEPGRITHVEALLDGNPVTLRGDVVVLAAGGFGSPQLLLDSAAEHWPQGCANESGLVGRNLMFHVNEMFALWPDRSARNFAPSRAIGLRDLYYAEGKRFGIVQAMGLNASYGDILHHLRMLLARTGLDRIRPLYQLARLPAGIAARFLGDAKIFVGLMEDIGYPENRILPPDGSGTLRFEYRFSDELLARRKAFRKAIRRSFRGQRKMFLSFQPELNFGHPCGTLRFGEDPATSVLNPDCRAHGIGNLYVTDSSFMPSSMGVNPSLTIAANALRVADRIAEARNEH